MYPLSAWGCREAPVFLCVGPVACAYAFYPQGRSTRRLTRQRHAAWLQVSKEALDSSPSSLLARGTGRTGLGAALTCPTISRSILGSHRMPLAMSSGDVLRLTRRLNVGWTCSMMYTRRKRSSLSCSRIQASSELCPAIPCQYSRSCWRRICFSRHGVHGDSAGTHGEYGRSAR